MSNKEFFKGKPLKIEDCLIIEYELDRNYTLKEIAETLKKDPATISKEINVPIPSSLYSELKEYRKLFPINIDNIIFLFKNTISICNYLIRIYSKHGFDISVHELRHT